jgi:hypothetical protein
VGLGATSLRSPGATLTARKTATTKLSGALGNRLVGIRDGCLRHHTLYDETIAWPDHAAPDV